MNRHMQRVKIVQMLYAAQYNEDSIASEIDKDEYCRLTFVAIMQERDNIDKLIKEYSENDISKIDCIPLQVLRLAIYEMINLKTSPKICISEAVNLCIDFSGDISYSFVNGVLDAVAKNELS